MLSSSQLPFSVTKYYWIKEEKTFLSGGDVQSDSGDDGDDNSDDVRRLGDKTS